MLMGGFLSVELVLALSHLLLCSYRISIVSQTGFDCDAKQRIADQDRRAVPFTLALVSQGMRTRHTRCATLRQPETVLIADASTRISMALMLNQP